jgi:hypothetical protein
VFRDKRTTMKNVYTNYVWISAFILVAIFGLAYRVLASHLKLIAQNPVVLPVSLSNYPLKIGHWSGKDVPIPPNIQRAAANDDFVNRLYVNETNNEWANLYIAYTARPRTMLGHRPQVCYPAGGWVHDSSKEIKVVSKLGTEITCLIHRFHMPEPQYEERVVLNYYVVNGQLTADESVFSGVGWRTPNIAGNPARYVAQVQLSSVLESYALAVVADTADLILDYFPDKTGQVRAEQKHKTLK